MNYLIKSIFFLTITLSQIVYAQIGSTKIIKKYSVKEGLSQGVVNSIIQDNKGLMWFATEDGLNRFDGYSFKVFKYDPDNTYGPADNFTQHVFKDSDGIIWVSSRRGLYKFEESTERFRLYRYNFPANTNDVSYILEGSAGDLWIAWYGGGFASFNKQTETFTPYTQKTLPTLTSINTITLYEDTFGLLWVGSQEKGLNVFKVVNGKLRHKEEALSNKMVLPSFYVKCIEEDHLGNIWIGTTKGLVVYIREENKFQEFTTADISLNGKGIFTLLEDTDKNLWIGTQGEGLYRVSLRQFNDRAVNKLIVEHIDVLNRYNIAQHTIRVLMEDKDKNIWMGTHGDGIYMISRADEKFIKIQTKKYVKSAESVVPYYGMCYDHEGNLWLGTDGDGIYRSTLNGDIINHFTADGRKGSITDNVILSALKDHDDNLWFGSYDQGLFLYTKRTGTFQNFNHAASDSAGHMGNQVRVIFEDSKKNIWVGSSRGGLCQVDKKAGTFKNLPSGGNMNSVDVRAIVEDKAGGLWVGGYGDGLYYLTPETGKAKRYFYRSEEHNLLKSNVVFALALDRKDRLWIGTGGGGLSVYDPAKNTLKRYTEKNGLSNNTICGILIDNMGKIWVSTNKGISKFDPDTGQFYNYNSFDGLQEGQFNPGAALRNTSEGYMCFGGSLGLTIFYPDQVIENFQDPSVMISGFQLFNKPVAINGEDNILNKAINETEKIVLKHNQSVFTFEFIALNYSYTERNKYAYKLEGLERHWNYVGPQRTATYRYLSPGNYTFKVKATNQNNVWPDEYASIKLVILPPFWKTPLAYFLYLLLITAIGYGMIIVQRKQASLRRRLRIEKAQRKRERELVRAKLSFFTEVSHEFRTPLTLMIGPLEEMLTREGNYTPTGKKLKMVYRNAHKLLNLINKLLDYRKVETGNMVLKVKEEDIVSFVEELFITFKELAIRKNINFHFHTAQPSLLVWFDKEKLEMVLNNILSNSFKYIGKGNDVQITIRKSESGPKENVLIEIKDNGIGIPKEQLRYIFDWFYQGDNASPVSSGIGLALARKLIYLHKGEIAVESAPGKGSVFVVKIPLGRDHFKPHEIIIDNRNDHLLLKEHFVDETEEDAHDENSHKKGLKSILLVEDDHDIRSFLREYLEKTYKIYEATDGKTGLTIALDHHPNLVISDIMMPEMNGIDLCKHLKSNIRTSHIPVILLTAKTSLTHHKEGIEIGADAYMVKPFSPDLLTLTIKNILQSRENLKRFYRNLFTTNGAVKQEPVSPDEKFLHRIYELLKSNLDNAEFNVNELCDELNMSRSLLYKKVKMLTGLSPVEYLRSLRLQEAAQLLKSHQYKVFEVVYMTGFTDLKYFRQCFTKEFGYSPSEILKNNDTTPADKPSPNNSKP